MDLSKSNKFVKLMNMRSHQVIADQCSVAKSFLVRARGLIGTREFMGGQAMLFPRCNSIHMWFMSIPIDVIFLKSKDHSLFEVTATYSNLQPWRFLPLSDPSANCTLELPIGTLKLHPILKGDLICLS
jgi:uncharacterized membrane protein (UPF0127 family)